MKVIEKLQKLCKQPSRLPKFDKDTILKVINEKDSVNNLSNLLSEIFNLITSAASKLLIAELKFDLQVFNRNDLHILIREIHDEGARRLILEVLPEKSILKLLCLIDADSLPHWHSRKLNEIIEMPKEEAIKYLKSLSICTILCFFRPAINFQQSLLFRSLHSSNGQNLGQETGLTLGK